MSPFNFSKDKTLAILASSKLTSFVRFTCFELLGVDVQLSELKHFCLLFCFCFYLAFVSHLPWSMMLLRTLSFDMPDKGKVISISFKHIRQVLQWKLFFQLQTIASSILLAVKY